MAAAFQPKCAVIVGEQHLQELIRILGHHAKCAQSHSTEYDTLNCFYPAVDQEVYALYVLTLVFDEDGNPVTDVNGVQVRQAMPWRTRLSW